MPLFGVFQPPLGIGKTDFHAHQLARVARKRVRGGHYADYFFLRCTHGNRIRRIGAVFAERHRLVLNGDVGYGQAFHPCVCNREQVAALVFGAANRAVVRGSLVYADGLGRARPVEPGFRKLGAAGSIGEKAEYGYHSYGNQQHDRERNHVFYRCLRPHVISHPLGPAGPIV